MTSVAATEFIDNEIAECRPLIARVLLSDMTQAALFSKAVQCRRDRLMAIV